MTLFITFVRNYLKRNFISFLRLFCNFNYSGISRLYISCDCIFIFYFGS